MSNSLILLVEDDQSLGYVIKDNLIQKGYQVTWCKNGQEALEKFKSTHFNLCLFDVMMPKKDGFSLAKEVRNISNIPILFITAKTMQEDKLKGFEIGADDYITKPFSMQELIYRIEVFLKRSSSSHEKTETFALGNYKFNYSDLSLKCATFEKTLTQKEANVLKYLCENIDKVIKREDMLKEIWGEDDYFLGRSMDVFISKLRKYLKEDPKLKITNYHGIGFKLTIDEAN